jgi:hypothetical protein
MKDPAARAQEALEEVDAHHGRRLVTSSAAASEPRPLRRLLGRAPKPPEPEPFAAVRKLVNFRYILIPEIINKFMTIISDPVRTEHVHVFKLNLK